MANYSKASELRRKRTVVGVFGFIIGTAIGVPITYMLYSVYFNFTTFSFGCAGVAFVLFFAEKKRKVSTPEEIQKLRLEERRKPLDIFPPSQKKDSRDQKNRPIM